FNAYRFELPTGRGAALPLPLPGGAPPPAAGAAALPARDLRHFALAFREGNSAKIAIESVRIISEQQETSNQPSGQRWAGLGEIYHATLAAKTPESIRIPLRELPP